MVIKYPEDHTSQFRVTKFVFKGFHPDTIYFWVAGLAISNDEYSSQNPTADLVIPSNMEFKKIKVTAVKMDIKKAVTITIDMKKIADSLGWEERLSGTWARHSFATNLFTREVPKHYISDAMGHTIENRGDITDRRCFIMACTMMKPVRQIPVHRGFRR